MAYQIDRYNGTIFSIVPDQTVDSSSCDLKLVGKNYAGYGEVQNENFLHLLENFRGTEAPRRPVIGQLWYDELTNKLKFYDDTTSWKTVSVTDIALTAPTGLSTKDKGNLWYNDTLKQLNVWDGSDYVMIGPELAVGFGETRLRSGTIRDNSNIEHAIIRVYTDSEVVAVISSDEFSIGTIDAITGFDVIKSGITLANTSTNGVTTTAHKFWGTASNSLKFNSLTLDDFVLRSPTGSTFTDTGFTVGNDSDLSLFVEDSNKPIIESTLGQPLKLRVTTGSTKDDVVIVAASGVYPNLNQSYDFGTTLKQWRNVYAKDVFANVKGTLQGNLLASDNEVLFNSNNKEFFGTHIGTQRGDVQDVAGNVCFDSTARDFFGNEATFVNVNADTFTLNDRVIGDLQGDVYASDSTVAYNAGTKEFTGTLIGNASSASQFDTPKYINGVAFDGTENITVVDSSRVAKNGDAMTGFLTLVANPELPLHAATKEYVDYKVASKTLFFSLDTMGLSIMGSGTGSVAAILNQLAPPVGFPAGTLANIASTIQNVSSSTSVSRGSWISISYVSNVYVTTTVQNPTRNNQLVYRVNSSQTSWEYVSG